MVDNESENYKKNNYHCPYYKYKTFLLYHSVANVSCYVSWSKCVSEKMSCCDSCEMSRVLQRLQHVGTHTHTHTHESELCTRELHGDGDDGNTADSRGYPR